MCRLRYLKVILKKIKFQTSHWYNLRLPQRLRRSPLCSFPGALFSVSSCKSLLLYSKGKLSSTNSGPWWMTCLYWFCSLWSQFLSQGLPQLSCSTCFNSSSSISSWPLLGLFLGSTASTMKQKPTSTQKVLTAILTTTESVMFHVWRTSNQP